MRPERFEIPACCVRACLFRFNGRSWKAGICGYVFGIVHGDGDWRDQIGWGDEIVSRIGFLHCWSSGRFDGLGRFEFSDALQKYAFEISQPLCILAGLHALFDLQEGQAQRFQRLMGRSCFEGGNHSSLQKVSGQNAHGKPGLPLHFDAVDGSMEA